MHLAAETHVDRSIDGPAAFVETNVVGTFRLLSAALDYWRGLDDERRATPSASTTSRPTRCSASLPSTKASSPKRRPTPRPRPIRPRRRRSDHFVRAWHETYGLPVVLSNCSNNYGPFHFPEKLIPLVILNALEGKPLPVYGEGANVRDWLYVDDHARALELVATSGEVGESYNVGGRSRAHQPRRRRDDLRHARREGAAAPAAAATAT